MQKKFIIFSTVFVIVTFYIALNIGLTQNHPSYLFDAIYAQKPHATVELYTYLQKNPQLSSVAERLSHLSNAEIQGYLAEKKAKQLSLISYYQNLLKKNPQATEVLIHLAQVYEETGNKTQALQYYEKAYRIDPTLQSLQRR